ncbi:MAG: plastocyanin/azurin family copper-binding protein [Chloroflexota bacterium]|nr:plastocyanin/azurin family copper-binding protein [Chloroflexota bacterium]
MSRNLRAINSSVLVASLLALTVGAGPAAASQPSQPAGGTNWKVLVGNAIETEQGRPASWQSIRFFPETITVNQGDSITWNFNAGLEPHNVVFLGPDPFPEQVAGPPPGAPGGEAGGPPPGGPPGGPGGPGAGGPPPQIPGNPKFWNRQGGNTYDGSQFVNSGVVAADIPGPKNYTLSFPKAGTYLAICTLHAGVDPTGKVQGMVQNVVVQAPGSALPKTQAQYDADVAALMEAEEAKALELEAEARSKVMSPHNAGGTNTYHVLAGYGSQDPAFPLSYVRFVPEETNLNVGDTIEWTDLVGGFHNVMFGEEPTLVDVVPGPDGQPQVLINLINFLPTGQPAHTGSGFYNSGILTPPGTAAQAEGGPFPLTEKYSLTFTQPGRYEYICSIHYTQGMAGFVTVGAGGGGMVGMPRTGSGDAEGWLYGLLALGLALAASGTALRMRKSGRIG